MSAHAPNQESKNDRFKQIELLFRYMETRAERHTRQASLIILGNAGAIATCSVILKDLRSQFDSTTIIVGAALFILGLIFAGTFSLLAGIANKSFRGDLFDLVLDERADIEKKVLPHKYDVDYMASLGSFYFLSAMCFFLGIGAVLYALYFGQAR